jgi:hypothetical protein
MEEEDPLPLENFKEEGWRKKTEKEREKRKEETRKERKGGKGGGREEREKEEREERDCGKQERDFNADVGKVVY